ncbi:hypothetical protein D9M72_254860 [compost metagenome]
MRGPGQQHRIRGGHGQGDADRRAGRVQRVVVRGAGEGCEDLGLQAVLGQAGAGLLAVDAHDLSQVRGGGDGRGKRAAEDELVTPNALCFHGDARGALQFQDRAHQHHREAVADPDGIGAGKVQDGMDAQAVQASGEPGGHAPEFDDGYPAHQRFAGRGRHGVPVAHAVEAGVVLRPLVGQLRESLGIGNSHADRHPDVAADSRLDGLSQTQELIRGPFDSQEGFIDAVNLQPGRVAP